MKQFLIKCIQMKHMIDTKELYILHDDMWNQEVKYVYKHCNRMSYFALRVHIK